MSAKDPSVFIEHILASIRDISLFTKNISKEEFISNKEKINAVVRSIEIIGEAAKNLPPAFIQQYPSIDWKGIIGTRNMIIHHYFGVNLHLIWDITKKDLPLLEQQLKHLRTP
ncbi:MAG TPA: DUF86 domain-containing protein [Candidatus Nanoarchaeia archaeon]|nr:DUF86 domain-containing protein [Candidatus Nanoarchaeia archaeon]